jgi:4-hydroxyphenylacetaldehyde oxime monooxygenase
VDKLIGRLSSAVGKAVQLEDHIFGLMDGVIGTVAFGNIYGTEQFAHKKHFHDVLDEAMSAKAGFSAEDYYPNAAGRLVDRLTGAAARRERVFRDLDAFFDTIIDQHMVDPSSRARAAPPGHGGPDLIDVFVDLMEERRQGRQVDGSLCFTRDHIKGLLSVCHASCSFRLTLLSDRSSIDACMSHCIIILIAERVHR